VDPNFQPAKLTVREQQIYVLGIENAFRALGGMPTHIIVVPKEKPWEPSILTMVLLIGVLYVICSLLEGNWWQWIVEELVNG
jgi:hypothetical protein